MYCRALVKGNLHMIMGAWCKEERGNGTSLLADEQDKMPSNFSRTGQT